MFELIQYFVGFDIYNAILFNYLIPIDPYDKIKFYFRLGMLKQVHILLLQFYNVMPIKSRKIQSGDVKYIKNCGIRFAFFEIACKNNDIKLFKYCMSLYNNFDTYNAFLCACKFGNVKIAKLHPNFQYCYNFHVMENICESDNLKFIKFLEKNGFQLNELFYYACQCNSINILNYMITNEIQVSSYSLESAISFANQYNNKELLDFAIIMSLRKCLIEND
jgi:hypothetical protein